MNETAALAVYLKLERIKSFLHREFASEPSARLAVANIHELICAHYSDLTDDEKSVADRPSRPQGYQYGKMYEPEDLQQAVRYDNGHV